MYWANITSVPKFVENNEALKQIGVTFADFILIDNEMKDYELWDTGCAEKFED